MLQIEFTEVYSKCSELKSWSVAKKQPGVLSGMAVNAHHRGSGEMVVHVVSAALFNRTYKPFLPSPLNILIWIRSLWKKMQI